MNEQTQTNIVKFYNYLRKLYISPNTLVNYVCQFNQFLNMNPSLLYYNNKQHEEKAAKFLYSRNNTSAKAAIGHFYNWSGKGRFWSRFKRKYRKILIQKQRRLKRKTLPVKRLFEIMDSCRNPYRVIFRIQYESGSRISEILNLEYEDISFDEDLPCVYINVLKTNNTLQKKSYITPSTGALLATYLDGLTNKYGKIFHRKYSMCNYVLKKATDKLGYKRTAEKISTHWIRITRANHIYSMTKDPMTIKKILGHVQLNTTETYIRESGETSRNIIERELKQK